MRNEIKGIVLAAGVLITLTGCSRASASQSAARTTSPATASAASLPDLKSIGEKKKDTYEIAIANDTGRDITGFAAKEDGKDSYGENMLKDTYKADEERYLYYAMDTAVASAGSDSSLKGAYLNFTVDVQLTFADGTTAELKDFPMSTAKDVTIKKASDTDGGFCYIEYQTEDKEQVSTFDTEKSNYDAAQKAAADKAAAEKAAADQAAAEQAAAAQAAAEQAQADQQQQQQAQTYTAPDTSSQQSGGGSSGCLDGFVLN